MLSGVLLRWRGYVGEKQMIDRRLAEDVLYAFSVEPKHDRQTLENYLLRYPELAEELIDLSHELRLVTKLEVLK